MSPSGRSGVRTVRQIVDATTASNFYLVWDEQTCFEVTVMSPPARLPVRVAGASAGAR